MTIIDNNMSMNVADVYIYLFIYSRSHPFFRAFYIPFLSEDYCKYNSYNLLKSNKFKLSPSKIKTPKAA